MMILPVMALSVVVLAQERYPVAPVDLLETHGKRHFAPVEVEAGALAVRRPGEEAQARVTVQRLAPIARPELAEDRGQPLSPSAQRSGPAARFELDRPLRSKEFAVLRVLEEREPGEGEPAVHFVFLETDDHGVAREVDWERTGTSPSCWRESTAGCGGG